MTAPASVEDAFARALRQDAAAAPPDIPAPPRRVAEDRDAPFGRDDAGQANAPFGTNKKTGRPNLRAPAAGAGRPSKDDQPRVQDGDGKTGSGAAPGKDYSADLAGFATGLWLTGSGWGVTAPYAAVLHDQSPQLVAAWNNAAQHNATVRAQVEKLAGEGSWAWVIQCVVATTPVLMACWDLAKPIKDQAERAERDKVKAELADRTKAEAQQYLAQQLEKMLGDLDDSSQLEQQAA